ncbi:MAG: YbaB/EbfC family nucleoid-associated protein, partial [Planctomycetota bacterium]
VNLKIDPARLGLGSASEGDLELLEDLIVAAVAAAQTKAAEAARQKTADEMKKITDDLDLPPEMLEGLGKLGG